MATLESDTNIRFRSLAVYIMFVTVSDQPQMCLLPGDAHARDLHFHNR